MLRDEDVFEHFRTLASGRRIELLCGLISMCIPLELKFFETFVKDIVTRDQDSLYDMTTKSNNKAEVEELAKYDLLSERTDFKELKGHPGLVRNSQQNSLNSLSSLDSIGGKSGSLVNSLQNGLKPAFSFPARSRMVIAMCLLEWNNRNVSTVIYQALRRQLTVERLQVALYQLYLPKAYDLESVFSEIILLLTLAMYHPAFNYEEKDIMMLQKEQIEEFINFTCPRFNPLPGCYNLIQPMVPIAFQHPQNALLSIPAQPQNAPLCNNVAFVPTPVLEKQVSPNCPEAVPAIAPPQFTMPFAALPQVGMQYSPQTLIQDMSVLQIRSPHQNSSPASSSPSPALSHSSGVLCSGRTSPRHSHQPTHIQHTQHIHHTSPPVLYMNSTGQTVLPPTNEHFSQPYITLQANPNMIPPEGVFQNSCFNCGGINHSPTDCRNPSSSDSSEVAR